MSRLSFLSAAFLIHPLLLLLPSSCSQTTSLTANKDNISDLLYLFSVKFYVLDIDYNNLTIRLVDAGVHKISDNYFSHPHYSLTRFNFSYYISPYILDDLNQSLLPVPIIFLSCENPMNSSAFIVETAPCINGISSYSSSNSSLSSLRTYSYFMVGQNTAQSLGKTCKITLMVMVSPSTEDNMTSCKGIYNEIAHGF
ncbi:unnamed protein product, partial [Prunus brigantina]